LEKSDIDLRQLTYQFPITTATEIEASIDSHPPIKYHILPIEVPVQDYSKTRLDMVDKINIALVEPFIQFTYFI